MNVRVNEGRGPFHQNMKCAVCKDQINDAAKVCAGCGVTTHPDCANEKCPTIGCVGKHDDAATRYYLWQNATTRLRRWQKLWHPALSNLGTICLLLWFVPYVTTCYQAGQLLPISAFVMGALVTFLVAGNMWNALRAAFTRSAYDRTVEIMLHHPDRLEDAKKHLTSLNQGQLDA